MGNIQMRTVTVTVASTTGPPQPVRGSTAFTANVLNAQCCVQSWDIGYTQNDKHFYEELLQITNILPSGTNVSFDVKAGVRDSSGVWDDAYHATVTVLVIAEISSN